MFLFYFEGGMTPSVHLSKKEQEAIISLIEKWIPRMNFNNACLHFELKCRPESIYHKSNFDQNDNLIDANDFLMPIEINMRLGGAETWSMTKTSCDIDLLREYIDIRLGYTFSKDSLRKANLPRYQCISKDFHPARNVLIQSIVIDYEKIRSLDTDSEICLFRSVGEKLTYNDYMGWVVVRTRTNTSYSELERMLNKVLTYIHFEFVSY